MSTSKADSNPAPELLPEHLAPGESEDGSGRYYRKERIGRGGFGEVFRAIDSMTGKEVALKVVDRSDDESLVRHGREVRAQRALQHPNVMPILDAGHGWHVMPVADTSLDAIGPALFPLEALDVMHQVATGLEQAHRQQLVHRDVSSRNILRVEGRWVLADFGLVRNKLSKSETMTVGVVGPPDFMAPEARHIGTHNLDERGDVYMFGLVMQWLVGEGGAFADVIHQMTRELLEERCTLTWVLEQRPWIEEALRRERRASWERASLTAGAAPSQQLTEPALRVLQVILSLNPNLIYRAETQSEATRRGVSDIDFSLGWLGLESLGFLDPAYDEREGEVVGERLSDTGKAWTQTHLELLRRNPPVRTSEAPSMVPSVNDAPF